MADSKYDYFTFFSNPDPKIACIEELADGIYHIKLRKGVRMGERFPPTAEIPLCEDGGDILNDFIDNIFRCVIISEKVKNILLEEGLDEEVVEYLPFILKDKKGRRVKTQYYFANPLIKCNCLDEANSRVSKHEDGEIFRIRKLNVLKNLIPEDTKLFRLGELTYHIIIRSDLVERLQKETTGLYLAKMGDKIY